MMVETYLLRGKRQLGKWMEVPWFRTAGKAALYISGGFLLSGAGLWGRMQPIAMGMTAGCAGWRCICAALGSMVGYRVFWGQAGFQGTAWVLGAMILALTLPFFGDTAHRKERLGLSCACLVCGTGLVFQYRFGEDLPTRFFLQRIGMAAACAMLSDRVLAGRNRAAQWIGAGFCVLALCCIPGSPGLAAAGALAAAAPLPAAALAGFGADLGGVSRISITAVAVLTFFLHLLPIREAWRRMAAPGAACLIVMVLTDVWETRTWILFSLGGVIGAQLPWRLTAVPRHRGVGRAQVQLEQTSRVLLRMQAHLLEYSPPPPDVSALLEQVKLEQCGVCVFSRDCREQAALNAEYITGTAVFPCRKSGEIASALRRARDQLKRIRASRAVQAECRTALQQQYGFLADMLRGLADSLPERELAGSIRFRILVSSRSRGKHYAEGDRVLAFPGEYCRYYVLLCDGMGTGTGAAEEGRQASELIRQMLLAGLPPASALGGLNSQLTLLGRGGAVTADLAEIRLDSGNARIYKWGAGPSWQLYRGRASQVGRITPPPGLDVAEPREHMERVCLSRGETLVMVSDGIDSVNAPFWARDADSSDPGVLAERILRENGSREDDATAVVIRLVPIHDTG